MEYNNDVLELAVRIMTAINNNIFIFILSVRWICLKYKFFAELLEKQ